MNQYNHDALGLSPTQAMIVRHIITGKCEKLIVRDTGLSRGTIKVHTSAALRKLGARNRAELIARVAELAGIDLNAHFERLRSAA